MAGLLSALVAACTYSQAIPSQFLRLAYNNGDFSQVVEKAPVEIRKYRRTGSYAEASVTGVLAFRAFIQLQKYDDAAITIEAALSDAKKAEFDANVLASVLFCKATLARVKQDFKAAAHLAREAFALAPHNRQVEIEYYLTIGRVLFSAGYDIAAIVWLEKAEKLFPLRPNSSRQLEVFRFLSLAWASKLNHAKAIAYAGKLVEFARNTEFRYQYRLALYDFATISNASGQPRKAQVLLERGFQLSLKEKNQYQSCLFLSSLLLNALYNGDVASAEKHLLILGQLDWDKRFSFEVLLGNAVIAGLKGQNELSKKYLTEIASVKNSSDHIVPYWKATIAEQTGNWGGVIEQNNLLLNLAERDNFREDLPGIYFKLARGYWSMGDTTSALAYAKKSSAMIDETRLGSEALISLSMQETYHSVYRLLADIAESENDIRKSLELSDNLKARVLKDRIENSALRRRPELKPELRQRAEDLSTRFIEGRIAEGELDRLERDATMTVSSKVDAKYGLGINDLNRLSDTAIVSYTFSHKGELHAYVLESGSVVRVVKLTVTDREAELMATSVKQKIRDLIFFKKDGKEVFDRLLAPLSLKKTHIIIVPDKSLWNIPFHALSADGESYLIERTRISYSPSVSLLLDSLKNNVPVRKTAQVFANDTFQERHLPHVNQEAAKIGRIFEVKPLIGATPQQFISLSGHSDILHFSMHAKAESEDPLNSFLGFRPTVSHNGRVTVEDLLKVRFKPQSLAFLASCDTNNVFNSEGIVSLAWAMLGSGSSSIISAQWEANDRSTELFAEEFYKKYREGVSAAEAIQAASIAMIRNKSARSHEPYYWAAFTLLGDFR